MIRNVLVSSTGTSEPMDVVRVVADKSTGDIGNQIAEAFAKRKPSLMYTVSRYTVSRYTVSRAELF